MNFKIAYLALSSFLIAEKTMAAIDSYEVSAAEGFIEIEQIVPSSREIQQQNKNRNCDFRGEITCRTLDNRNLDCAKIPAIRKDLCKPIPIELSYKYCNDETDPLNKIILLPSLSYADLYEENKIKVNTNDLLPGKCHTVKQQGKINCSRGRVNAEMKLEGWKTKRKNYGSYCHVYKHYFPKINRFSLPPTVSPSKVPTSAPTYPEPDYKMIVECFLESAKGSEEYTVPCEEMGIDYFQGNRRRFLQEGELVKVELEVEDPDFERNIKYIYSIASNTDETVQVNEIFLKLDGERTSLVSESDNLLVLPGETKVVADYSKLVDFAVYSGVAFELESKVTVTGKESEIVTTKVQLESISVPPIEFKWILKPMVTCTIKETLESCEDYIANIPAATPEFCQVDVQYGYTVVNTGDKCEPINKVIPTINESDLPNIAPADWNFCPDQTRVLYGEKFEDLCALAGEEIGFELALNDVEEETKSAYYVFPIPNVVTAPPTFLEFLWRLEPLVTCRIKLTGESCEDYMSTLFAEIPSYCEIDVVYDYTVVNIGEKCQPINSVVATMNQDQATNIPVTNWNFCPGDRKTLEDERRVDLCDMAGEEAEFELALNGDEEEADGAGYTFPIPTTKAKLVLSDVNCFVVGTSADSGNGLMTCADYITFHLQRNLPCTRDLLYTSRLKNVGDKCTLLEEAKTYIEGIAYNTYKPNWSDDNKLFCPQETLKLKKKVKDVHICNYANSEIPFKVVTTGSNDEVLSAEGSIQFPGPNAVTPYPTPSPSEAPGCHEKPDRFTFKLEKKTCDKSVNSQAVKRTRRMKKSGKGSIKQPCGCQSCEDFSSCNITTMNTEAHVTITNKKTGEVLFDNECITFSSNFIFEPAEMPDCIEISIKERYSNGKYHNYKTAQVVAFETLCTPDAPLAIGDTFGAVEIVKL